MIMWLRKLDLATVYESGVASRTDPSPPPSLSLSLSLPPPSLSLSSINVYVLSLTWPLELIQPLPLLA